jgi:folylpolyglutamate synthase/dihydropteroate synthase
MPVEELAALASSAGRTGSIHQSVADALAAARSSRTGQELVVVLGSVFTVGEALTALQAG